MFPQSEPTGNTSSDKDKKPWRKQGCFQSKRLTDKAGKWKVQVDTSNELLRWYFSIRAGRISAFCFDAGCIRWDSLQANKSAEFVRLPIKVFLRRESEHFLQHRWQNTDSSAWAVYEAHPASVEWKLLQGHIHSIKAWPWHPRRTSKDSRALSSPLVCCLPAQPPICVGLCV